MSTRPWISPSTRLTRCSNPRSSLTYPTRVQDASCSGVDTLSRCGPSQHQGPAPAHLRPRPPCDFLGCSSPFLRCEKRRCCCCVELLSTCRASNLNASMPEQVLIGQASNFMCGGDKGNTIMWLGQDPVRVRRVLSAAVRYEAQTRMVQGEYRV